MSETVQPPKTYSISATEARAIMQGHGREVWEIKKGLAQPEDLTWKFPVQLGSLSESLNRSFYQYENKRPVYAGTSASFLQEIQSIENPRFTADWDTKRSPPDIECRSKTHTWMTCHPDGLTRIDGVLGLWEAKHTDAVSDWNEPERVVRHNWWQLVHQMSVLDMPWCEVSVIYGNGNVRKVHRVHRDMNEEAVLIGTLLEFMASLNGEVPFGGNVAQADAKMEKGGSAKWVKAYGPDDLKDLPCANEYPERAEEFLKYEAQAGVFDAAKKALKDMIPEDGVSLAAHGVTIKRNAKGAISVERTKVKKEKSRAA